MNSLHNKAAIAGIGCTEFSKASGRSELSLASEAVVAAVTDAGLAPSEIDGLVSYTLDPTDEIEVARSVGAGDLTFFSKGQLWRWRGGWCSSSSRYGRGNWRSE